MRDNRAGEAYWGHPRVFRLHYEELVGNFDAVMPRICDFLGEPYDASMRNFHKRDLTLFRSPTTQQPPTAAGKHHAQLRNWQINQQLFNGAGKWKREMTADEKAYFKQHAGQMLIDYGYAADMEW